MKRGFAIALVVLAAPLLTEASSEETPAAAAAEANGVTPRAPSQSEPPYAPSETRVNGTGPANVTSTTSNDGASGGVPVSATGAGPNQCPSNMVLVEGEYCTEVQHVCKHWLDDEKLQYARCGDYERSPTCVGKRIAMRYCIDKYEYTKPGEQRPLNYGSFATATKICHNLGKRVCTESEWNFACEGEEMRPYPYGFTREPKCNQDQAELYVRTPKKLLLKDLRAESGSHPDCVSPFGVYDMVGNMDESVLRESARYNYPFRNALKGGWWMSGRNRCRPATTAHDDHYEDVQVGVRCCANSAGAASGPSG